MHEALLKKGYALEPVGFGVLRYVRHKRVPAENLELLREPK